jgi:hypothetical protein
MIKAHKITVGACVFARNSEGLPVNGGYDLSIPVRFTPSTPGHTTGTYTLTWTDRLGTHTIAVPVTATGVAGA